MNDRELLEYIAAQVGSLTAKVDVLGNDVKDLQQGQIKIQSTIENDVSLKISGLFDGHAQNTEAIKGLSSKMDEISSKIETHDVEISVIKRVK